MTSRHADPHVTGWPTRAELLQRSDGGEPGTSWGIFPDPWRGAPSFADAPENVLAATRVVRRGEAFGLDYPADAFVPGMSRTRGAPEHTIFANHPAHRDDYLDGFYLQGSSQIDGLRHRRSDDVGFYAGVPDERVRAGTPDLGVQVWAETPIVTRGILLDLQGVRAAQGRDIDHPGGEQLPFALIEQALAAQDVTLRTGDAVMLHTGWAEWFLGLSADGKHRQQESRRATGMAQSAEFVDWAWDSGVSLVAADNFAVECLPVANSSPFTGSAPNDKGMMHQELLAKLGIPLGELWQLGPIAARMREHAQWECLLTVKPLNVVGATGSPANATAIL
ncbi:cyclase family protein [Citricoccus sp. NPDC055426]|uniref:cyclase family protein n=1 Tax=Citricoccus sp. NPDC055426 TaxID=3155536 RepID=UPI003422E11A